MESDDEKKQRLSGKDAAMMSSFESYADTEADKAKKQEQKDKEKAKERQQEEKARREAAQAAQQEQQAESQHADKKRLFEGLFRPPPEKSKDKAPRQEATEDKPQDAGEQSSSETDADIESHEAPSPNIPEAELDTEETRIASEAYIQQRRAALAAEQSVPAQETDAEQPNANEADDQQTAAREASEAFLRHLEAEIESHPDRPVDDELLDRVTHDAIDEVTDQSEAEDNPADNNSESLQADTETVEAYIEEPEHVPAAETEDDVAAAETTLPTTTASTATPPPTVPPPPTPPSGGGNNAGGAGGGGGIPPIGGGATLSHGPNALPRPSTLNQALRPQAPEWQTGNQPEQSTKKTGAGEFLVGGVVGYLLGRRHGRRREEAEQAPARRSLERRVDELQTKLAVSEQQVRTATEQPKSRVESSPPPEKPPREQVVEAQPKIVPEPVIPHREQSPPPRLEVTENPEPVVVERVVATPQPETPPPESFMAASTTSNAEQQPEPTEHIKEATSRQVESVARREVAEDVRTMPLQEVLTLAAVTTYHGESLRRMHETGQLDERELRTAIERKLRGERYERYVSQQLETRAQQPERQAERNLETSRLEPAASSAAQLAAGTSVAHTSSTPLARSDPAPTPHTTNQQSSHPSLVAADTRAQLKRGALVAVAGTVLAILAYLLFA